MICHSWPSITSTSPFLKSAVLGTVGESPSGWSVIQESGLYLEWCEQSAHPKSLPAPWSCNTPPNSPPPVRHELPLAEEALSQNSFSLPPAKRYLTRTLEVPCPHLEGTHICVSYGGRDNGWSGLGEEKSAGEQGEGPTPSSSSRGPKW